MHTALKYDGGKLRWDLLPLDIVEEIVRVYTAGSIKYGDNQWQDLENGEARYMAACFRHICADSKGDEVDEETGCLHLAQAAWNLIAVLWIRKHKKENDDTIVSI